MTIKFIFYQIEISFWNLAIPLMQNSRLVRYFAPRLHLFVRELFSTKAILVTIGCLAAGLSLGYFLGVLSQIL